LSHTTFDDDMPPVCCPDCGTDLMPDTPIGSQDWQRYMVHDQVWRDAGLKPRDGWFCIPCLEVRLHRPLTGADFKVTSRTSRSMIPTATTTPRA
jgi:hypothetical protein